MNYNPQRTDYGRGLDDGIKQERTRIREAILGKTCKFWEDKKHYWKSRVHEDYYYCACGQKLSDILS